MEKKITVSINVDITFKATKEEEKILDTIDNASWTDTLGDEDAAYDEAMDKLAESIRNRLEKTYGKDFHILDINWD